MEQLVEFIKSQFGVEEDVFHRALLMSPGSIGAISGAISEILLKTELENQGFEAIRIKEKPKGGNNAKTGEAKGDFYIRKKGEEDWYVVECKNLKTNSEFRGDKLSTRRQVFNYLKNLAFPKSKQTIFDKGFAEYSKVKVKWEAENKRGFPPFNWHSEYPGAINANLEGLWKDQKELKAFIESVDDYYFTEEAYRKREGIVKILETHKPSQRVDETTGIKFACPLVSDFSILAVDLFLRTGKHEFVYMNPQKISHSPTSPNHLYQNYTIDVLVKGVKEDVTVTHPWYRDINELIRQTSPEPRPFDDTQVDHR